MAYLRKKALDPEALEHQVRMAIEQFAQAFPPATPADIPYDVKEVWGNFVWLLVQHSESFDALAWLIGDIYQRLGVLALEAADIPREED